MKFLCERDELYEAVNAAGRALLGRVTSGVKLALVSEILYISGRGPDLMVEVELTVRGVEDGITVVPAALFADLVRSMPEGVVECTADDNTAIIKAARTELSVQTYPDLDPPFIRGDSVDRVTISSDSLREGLHQVVRASSKDDTRDVMYTGILFSSTDTGLRLVATDGIRLALRDMVGMTVLNSEVAEEVIVPARSLVELDRIIQSAKSEIKDLSVNVSAREAVFSFDRTILTTRLIDGKFRDYKQLLQPSYPRILLVDKQTIVEGLRRLRRLAKEAREMTHLRCEISATSMELSVRIPQVGQAKESFDVTFSGEEFAVAFDPELLLDGIDAVTSDIVRIEFTENNRPACISNADNKDLQYIVMPIKLK
jgi:DNA polymerase-3 subunit beta